MRQRLFVYGTLLDEAIQQKVIGRIPVSQLAILLRYRRIRSGSHPWPALRPAFTAKVCGKILYGINRRQLIRLDRYEGSEYRRRHVRVCLPDGSRSSAWTYVDASRRGIVWLAMKPMLRQRLPGQTSAPDASA